MSVGTFDRYPDAAPSPGDIGIWTGTLSNIPSGWVLCDGNNGTPNLLDKFVESVPDTTTSTGSTAGSDSISLSTSQLPSHSHTGSVGSTSNHQHDYRIDSVGTSGSSAFWWGGSSGSESLGSAGSHSHSLNDDATGSGSSIDNRPNYYDVAYIMKT